MDRRVILKSIVFVGAASCLGFGDLFKSDKKEIVRCKLEDFWDTVKYQKEIIDGSLQRNVYRIEDYPTCSIFRRVKFQELKNNDYYILITSKLDYIGPNTGYGWISRATSDVIKNKDVYGINVVYKNMPQCWVEKAWEKHMILSGANYYGPSGHYKNGVRIG